MRNTSEYFHNIGVPIADEKSVGPKTIVVFLRLELDTKEMVLRIPLQNIWELVELLGSFHEKKKVTHP